MRQKDCKVIYQLITRYAGYAQFLESFGGYKFLKIKLKPFITPFKNKNFNIFINIFDIAMKIYQHAYLANPKI